MKNIIITIKTYYLFNNLWSIFDLLKRITEHFLDLNITKNKFGPRLSLISFMRWNVVDKH